jgi:hypothetical protein
VIDGWNAVTIIIHILWGSLFISAFGFSFSILRISMLVMSLAGILVSYRVLYGMLKQRKTAFLLSLFIAFNPVFFNLSFTYMTDLTFYSMMVCSVFFYILSFEKKSGIYIYMAALFSLLASLTRQVGLIVPLSAVVVVIISERKLLSRKVMKYFLHTLFIIAVVFTYLYWLKATGRQGEGFRNMGDIVEDQKFIPAIFQRMVDHSGRWLAETGLWFLPLSMIFILHTWKIFKRYLLPAGTITLLLGVAIILQTSHFPGGNIFYVLGLGPRTLMDVYILGNAESTGFIEFTIVTLRALALIGGVLLTWIMVANIFDVFNRLWKGNDTTALVKLFSFVLIIVYQGVFLASFTYFDRYAIPLFIPVLLLVLPPLKAPFTFNRRAVMVTGAFLLVLAFFSIMGTRHYLEWNQARWDAAEVLVQQGVDATDIDAGLEYIGWQGTQFGVYGTWDAESYNYAVTFTPLEGYEVLGKEAYQGLIPFSKEYIYILRKK